MKNSIKIAIAEDFALERTGLIALLKQFGDLKIVLAAGNGKELLEGLKTISADIVLLDIEMEVMDGRETFAIVRMNYPDLKIIMLTEHFSDAYIFEFMNKGACAFLSKNNRIEKVIETIRRVHVEGSCYDHIVARVLLTYASTGIPAKPAAGRAEIQLTVREIEIIRLMCLGKENKEMMTLLNIEVRTVETHRRNIWAKTNCKNIVELMEYAFRHNLISI